MNNLSEIKIAYISTYYPQRCGIAAYTSFLVEGIREVSPKTHVRIIAEREALAVKEEFLRLFHAGAERKTMSSKFLRI